MIPETHPSERIDHKYYEVAAPRSIAEKVAARARAKMYSDFIRMCRPCHKDKVLDVGVSDVITDASNMLERLYPHPERITAAGIGSPSDFEVAFPRVRYRQIEANKPLPFSDQEFDIVTSNAVLEHVGSVDNQRRFLEELFRVGRRIFVTVPHRLFPIEHHTGIPILHWTDLGFAFACRLRNKDSWALPENLILMSRRRLLAAAPPDVPVKVRYTGLQLGSLSSNLFLYAERSDA